MTLISARLGLIIHALTSYNYGASDEYEIQDQIADALAASHFDARREHSLSAQDRIDFLVGDVGVEVKVDGSRNAVLRQLARYARHDDIGSVLLVTTRAKLTTMPEALNGKTVRVMNLSMLGGGL